MASPFDLWLKKFTLNGSLEEAYKRKDLQSVERIVQNFPDPKYAHNNRIYLAIQYGDEKEVESLITDPRTNVNWTHGVYEGTQGSLLHKAAADDKIRILDLLLKSGANINVQDCFGDTPLHVAARRNCKDVVDILLLHGSNLDTQNDDGGTPLHAAAANNSVDVLSKLISHGAALNTQDNRGWTPIYQAAYRNSVDVLSKLISHGAALNTQDNDGDTVIHLVVRWNQVDVLSELSSHGAALDTRNNDGDTPIHLAARWNKVDVLSELISHGAALDARNNDGETALDIAKRRKREKFVKILEEAMNNEHLDKPDSSDIKDVDILSRRPELAELENHVRTIKWHAVGLQLQLEENDLVAIEREYRGDIASCRRSMFDLWLKTFPGASRKQLLDGLKSKAVAEIHMAEQYRECICRQLSQTPTPTINDEELQKMEQAFQTSVQEHGALKVNLAHYMPFGPPGVGKTCLLRRLVDKDPLGDPATFTNPCGNSQSTDAFEERHPIQVTVETRSDYEPKAVVTDNTKWPEVENVKEEIAILVKTLANRPDDSDSLHPDGLLSPHPDDSHSPPIITNESSNSQEVHPISLEVNTNPTTPSVDISHTPTSKHIRELVQKAVKDRNIDDVQELLDNSMTLYCTDTGGQPEFQEVLPALIAGPVIFLFIFNLFTGLNSKYNVTFRTPSQKFEQFMSTFTVKQVLMQFLTSIASYHMFISHSLVQQTSIPPPSVVVIGTHRDLITDEAFRMIDEELWKVFEEASFESFKKNIIVPFNDNQLIIPINNYSEDNDSISVRRVIQSVVKDHYNIEVPVPWLALALHLRDLPDSAVTYTKCKEIARGYNISDDELPQCLMFLHHRTGTIRYYPDVKELKDTIIIKPSIIFHAVTQLITSTFALKNVRNIEKKKYAMYGLIEKSHVEQIFSDHKLEISYEAFLALLKYLYILGHSHDSKHGDYFFPCALVHAPESDDISTSVDPLLLVFGCGFVPKGFFSSLLAFLCQKKWEIERLAKYKPCIYRNEASFFVDEYQNVNVRLKATNNCLEISIKDDNAPPDVFCKILQILNQGILEICSRLKYDKEFSKPQFGFYCNYQTCRQGEKHFAVHNGMSMVKCDDTGKSYDMDSKRKLWFQDCSSDTPVVPPTPHYDDKMNKETHNPRNISFRDLLKKPPEMDDLVPLMKDISASWNEIGIELKVPPNDRDSLSKNATLSDYGKMDTVIRNWNGTQKTDVTWKTILNTLNEKRDVRTKVIEFLEKPENYAKYINKADFVCTTYS